MRIVYISIVDVDTNLEKLSIGVGVIHEMFLYQQDVCHTAQSVGLHVPVHSEGHA